MTAALRRRPVRLAALAVLVLAAGLALWLVARGDEAISAPHAGNLSRAEAARYLKAVDAAAAGQSRAELVAEGRRLFRSASDAKDGESCQTCHVDASTNPGLGVIPHPIGDGDLIKGPRDAPALWTAKETAPFRWGGDIPTLEAMTMDTVKTHFTDRPAAEQADAAAALAAYIRSLDPPQSDFDNGTLSAAARRGEDLFQGKGGCIGCHGGPDFTDNGFHVLNVPEIDASDADPGQIGSSPPAFNTPSLRDVANTAPYFHNGSKATLTDVVRFYNNDSSIAPLGLTGPEVDDLVAYLESLSR